MGGLSICFYVMQCFAVYIHIMYAIFWPAKKYGLGHFDFA